MVDDFCVWRYIIPSVYFNPKHWHMHNEFALAILGKRKLCSVFGCVCNKKALCEFCWSCLCWELCRGRGVTLWRVERGSHDFKVLNTAILQTALNLKCCRKINKSSGGGSNSKMRAIANSPGETPHDGTSRMCCAICFGVARIRGTTGYSLTQAA